MLGAKLAQSWATMPLQRDYLANPTYDRFGIHCRIDFKSNVSGFWIRPTPEKFSFAEAKIKGSHFLTFRINILLLSISGANRTPNTLPIIEPSWPKMGQIGPIFAKVGAKLVQVSQS